MGPLRKFPRTPHIEGSRLQFGDEDLAAVPFKQIANEYVVIEEKVDGSNCGISFSKAGKLQLQSRGHYLTGGPRESQFDLFKSWASTRQQELWDCIGDRYVIYGEWLYAKHTIFYDSLPHYFLEFDVLDLKSGFFLCTDSRRRLLQSLQLQSVPTLFSGQLKHPKDLRQKLGHSQFVSKTHRQRLADHASALGLDASQILRETDNSPQMEGLYIKSEVDGRVSGRYKFVRPDFLAAVVASNSHWFDRPIIPNLLKSDESLFPARSQTSAQPSQKPDGCG